MFCKPYFRHFNFLDRCGHGIIILVWFEIKKNFLPLLVSNVKLIHWPFTHGSEVPDFGANDFNKRDEHIFIGSMFCRIDVFRQNRSVIFLACNKLYTNRKLLDSDKALLKEIYFDQKLPRITPGLPSKIDSFYVGTLSKICLNYEKRESANSLNRYNHEENFFLIE